MFNQPNVTTDEFVNALFSVSFAPPNTDIPFTFRVETFDLLPPDAQGLSYV